MYKNKCVIWIIVVVGKWPTPQQILATEKKKEKSNNDNNCMIQVYVKRGTELGNGSSELGYAGVKQD